MTDSVLCSNCGWTGQPDDLQQAGGDSSCPVCSESIAYDENETITADEWC